MRPTGGREEANERHPAALAEPTAAPQRGAPVNIKVTAHNVITIGLVAALFTIALRMAARTQVANVPVLGQLVRTVAAA